MSETPGARTFHVPGETYDGFMGRYSRPLAAPFAEAAGVAAGQTALDVGCGPGALTEVLAARLGARAVQACDPSPAFRGECARRLPGVEVRTGRAEELPFDSETRDLVLAQLVLHFVTDPHRAAEEMARVARPGGVVGACVWDFAEGMQMLRAFWDAALAIDPGAPDEARTMRFGRPGEIAELFAEAGLADVRETTLSIDSTYAGFEELWHGFLAGVGPAGSYCVGLPDQAQSELRRRLWERLGQPREPFTLGATARCVVARRPA